MRISERSSWLAKSKHNIKWLRPKAVNNVLYIRTSIINLVTIIFLIIYNTREEVLSYQSFTIFLISIILLYTSFYYKFNRKKKPNIAVYLCLTFAGLLIFLQWFLYELTLNEIFYLLAFLFLLCIFLYREEFLGFFQEPPSNKPESREPSFRESYTQMLFTFLVICAVLPSIFIFYKIYQEEHLIWNKHALYELNKRMQEREGSIIEKYQFFTEIPESDNVRSRLLKAWQNKGTYYLAGGYENGVCKKTACHSVERVKKPISISYNSYIQEARSDHYLLSIFQKVRPNIAGLVAETNGFMLSQGYNAKWSPVYREITEEKGSKKDMVHIHIDNQPTSLQTTNVASPFPSLFKGNISFIYILLLSAVLAVFLYLIYLLVNYILRTYFSWNIFTLSKALALSDDEYIKLNPCLKNKRTFFITTSSPRKVCLTGFETVNLTLIDRPEAEHDIQKRLNSIKNNANVLLENFSYNPKSIEAWNKKLEILEELVHIDDVQVAIQSHIRPLQIFEVYEKEIQRAEHEVHKHQKSDAPNSQTVADDLNKALARWKDVLASFFKVYLTPDLARIGKPNSATVESEVKWLLKSEMSAWPEYFSWLPDYMKLFDGGNSKPSPLRTSNYSWITRNKKISPPTPQLQINPYWLEYKASSDPKIIEEIKEEVILKIQSMAQPFYFSLWNNCSMEEKYVLFDLAEDGFVNPKARNQIYLLMEKGLIYQDENDQLHIRNKSFRNFILTNIKKGEAVEIEKQVSQTGTYSILKAAVVVIAISSFGFIAFTNQTQLEDLAALLTGLAAVIPMLFRFGGWFGGAEGLKP